MLQGVCMPAMQAVLAQWSPPMDRTIMVAFTYSGEFSFRTTLFTLRQTTMTWCFFLEAPDAGMAAVCLKHQESLILS